MVGDESGTGRSNGTGTGRAALIEADVEFDGSDAALLTAIDRTGSVAGAARRLGRSRARALRRIEMLEDAFGPLVERRRGGTDGGGSALTGDAAALLDRYHRLAATLDATATVPETVLSGTVEDISGEMATVDTQIGTVQGIHDGSEPGDSVQVRIGADAITLHDTDQPHAPSATSASHRYNGRVVDVNQGETVDMVVIDVQGVRFRTVVTRDSANRLGLDAGPTIAVTWKATATRVVSVHSS